MAAVDQAELLRQVAACWAADPLLRGAVDGIGDSLAATFEAAETPPAAALAAVAYLAGTTVAAIAANRALGSGPPFDLDGHGELFRHLFTRVLVTGELALAAPAAAPLAAPQGNVVPFRRPASG